MKKLILGFCLLGSSSLFAANTINVTVTTNDQNAAGIGYAVNGKKIGGSGKTYTGKGPVNSVYSFGYRKNSPNGKDVSCGSHRLKKDSYVFLIAKGNKCRSIVKR
ncbi:hypothetical protein OQJ18_06850 [Fluoribacter dumoffii]|uniref:Uncharacterized protein n=1 Tax=Fluoribacter dumoffii TaxID=463 RepID=A0A377G883_9GAMM|nr:hypothetical protein [Fluoribacter dumoffii]KTC89839.1 hypothetical protein Ldum_0907 [Fluoribacter dumoffii NY 23]MCW8385134.1 hypothetical protein [Fluoribacter dumoffii]MCW8418190.1 hypothetical protein [Fluoribacter dumoffii]MCW8453968.1 hypothetical protein [Fluoribacter dumoffii]MCW8461961.1 hypothetical protein [Fluoribacter dumoffii]